MRHVFQGPPATLPADRPMRVRAQLAVDVGGVVTDLTLRCGVQHSDPRDLVARLIAPWGKTWEFPRAQVPSSERLAVPSGTQARGLWRFEVDDLVAGDGGRVDWSLELSTSESAFQIEVDFSRDRLLTNSQKALFSRAAERWSEVIVGDLPEAKLPDGRTVDDLVLFAEARNIDGPGAVLGQAGPTHLRFVSNLPIAGVMAFDAADLAAMEADGSLLDVILHEMAHVLGVGTLWDLHRLLVGSGTSNPRFTGAQARTEWAALSGKNEDVPVENTGGAGTREGHWRESILQNELLTGWIQSGVNPLSRLTVASLGDLGYQVDADRADAFSLPGAQLAMSIGRLFGRGRSCACSTFTPIRIR
jgi:subtilisin-like proprotein convertase family protein